MSVAQMRAWLIANMNYGPSWVRQVEGYPDKQVVAVYNRIINKTKEAVK